MMAHEKDVEPMWGKYALAVTDADEEQALEQSPYYGVQ
jgi:hypothetical protein